VDLQKELENIFKPKEHKKLIALADEFAAKIKALSKDGHHLDAPIALARAIENFDLKDGEDDLNPNQLYLQWTIERFFYNKILEAFPVIEELYDLLVKHGLTEEKLIDYNDLDNKVFYIPTPQGSNYKIFSISTQRFNFLYCFGSSMFGKTLLLRRYWDEYEPDEYLTEEFEEADDKIRWAISQVNNFEERYSDDFPGADFVHRPSLAWWKRKGFVFKDYQDDTHDDGRLLDFIAMERRCSGASYRQSMAGRAIWELPFAVDAILEECEGKRSRYDRDEE